MTGPEVVRTLMSTAVGYVRWTQMVPMLVAWTFAWGALAAFALANFQETGMPIAAAAVALWEQHAWLPRMDTSGMTAADGSLHVETEDIRGLVLSVWGVAAGALYLLSILVGLVWPDRQPWRLRTKLQLAAGLGAATFGAYAWIWTRSEELFHGSTLAWLGVFLVLSGFPVVVSAYSLTVGAVLDTAQSRVGQPTGRVGASDASDAQGAALLLLALVLAPAAGAVAQAPTEVPRPASAALPRVDPAVVVAIGGVDGPEETQFTRVASAVRLSTGEIVVVDRGANQLRWFSRTGAFVRAVGRQGQGPGEFEGLRALHALSGDSLLAEDGLLARLTVFTGDGALVRAASDPIAAKLSVTSPVGPLSDGSFIAIGEQLAVPPAGRVRFDASVMRIHTEGRADTLTRLPGRESFLLVCGPNNEAVCNVGLPYGPLAVAAVGSDRVVTGNSERYALLVIDARRGTVDTITRNVARERLTPARVAFYRDSIIERLPPTRQQLTRERLAQAPSPEFMPFFTELRLDDAGRIWVARPQGIDARERSWDVFGAAGAFLGTVALPARLRVTQIARGYILGVSTDEDDVETIELRRLIP